MFAACNTPDNGGTKPNPDSGTTQPENPDNLPDDGGEDKGEHKQPVQLVAPVISLDEETAVISWNTVEHANYYEVYEDAIRVARVTTTTYTIAQYDEGTYVYSVKAFSVSADYTASEFSNFVTYTVESVGGQQEILEAPVIALDGNVLSWSAVEHADSYSIYENGVLIATIAETSYTIRQYMPAEYTYMVRAKSNNFQYVISSSSNAVTRTVTAQRMTYTVILNLPATLKVSEIIIGLFEGNTPVDIDTVAPVGGNGVYRYIFNATISGEVTVRVVYLPSGYTCTESTLNPNNRTTEITVYTVSNGKLVLGNNSVIVSTWDEEGADIDYTFVAEKGGAYTVSTEEAMGIVISVNGILVIDATQQFRQSIFYAEAGETVVFTIICEAQNVNYTFKIKEGAEKRYFEMGSGFGDTPNMFVGAGTYYLNVETAGIYTFHFGPTLGNYGVTFKIDGVEHYFGWYGIEDAPEDAQLNIIQIDLSAGEIEIEITLSENYWNDLMGFYIYPAI